MKPAPVVPPKVVLFVVLLAVLASLVPLGLYFLVPARHSDSREVYVGSTEANDGFAVPLYGCAPSVDPTKETDYSCPGAVIMSRFDSTGKDPENTLRRVLRAETVSTTVRVESVGKEGNFHRLVGTMDSGNPYIVLSRALEGEDEGMSLYVSLYGPRAELYEELVRSSVDKELEKSQGEAA